MSRSHRHMQRARCVIRPTLRPTSPATARMTGDAPGADSTGMPDDLPRSPRTPRGASITTGHPGAVRRPITLRRPQTWAADRDGRGTRPRKPNAGEGEPRSNRSIRPGARRSRRPAPSCHGRCRRPACAGGHRALHPFRDPGDRNTDRVVRAIVVVARRVALSRRRGRFASKE
jgi:hypothetical protein